MGLVSVKLWLLLIIDSIIENNCTEDFAEEVDTEVVIEKNTFDGFKVISAWIIDPNVLRTPG